MVLETAALSEAELSAYCRRKGLYAEQIETWKRACQRANGPQTASREEHAQRQAQARRIQDLEAELRRKDKALAETSALLVLTKKATCTIRKKSSIINDHRFTARDSSHAQYNSQHQRRV